MKILIEQDEGISPNIYSLPIIFQHDDNKLLGSCLAIVKEDIITLIDIKWIEKEEPILHIFLDGKLFLSYGWYLDIKSGISNLRYISIVVLYNGEPKYTIIKENK